MNNSLKKSRLLTLGFFFLFFATNAYVISGNLGKYFSLLIAITFICFGSIENIKIFQRKLGVIINAVVYFLILLIVAFLQNQNTTDLLTLSFDLVCLMLFIFGMLYGSQGNSEYPFSNKGVIKIVLSILIVIGAYKLYQLQASTLVLSNSVSTSRQVEDRTLNPNGIAYSQAQLLLLFLWLLSNEKKNILKITFILSILSILIAMIMTESRGALVYVVLTIVFFYFRSLSFKKIVFLTVISVFSFFVLSNNKIFLEKIELFENRFLLAINFANDKEIDGSLEERKELQNVFFQHYDEMFFGHENYLPYPHNQFIEIFMRWGVLGLGIFILSLRSFLICILYKSKTNTMRIDYLILTIFFFSYLQSMTSLSLDNNRFLWFGFGYLLSKTNIVFKEKEKNLVTYQKRI